MTVEPDMEHAGKESAHLQRRKAHGLFHREAEVCTTPQRGGWILSKAGWDPGREQDRTVTEALLFTLKMRIILLDNPTFSSNTVSSF